MSWHWEGPASAGADLPELGLGQPFPSQAEAEAWLTEVFVDLVEGGVTEATLYEDDRLVYGPMSLLAEGPA